jgi:hypothetical protein
VNPILIGLAVSIALALLYGIYTQLGRIADCQESRRIVETGEKPRG